MAMTFTPEQIKAEVARLSNLGYTWEDIAGVARDKGVPLYQVGRAVSELTPEATMDFAGRNGVSNIHISDTGMSPAEWLQANGYGTQVDGYDWQGELQWSDRLNRYLPRVSGGVRGDRRGGRWDGGAQQQQPSAGMPGFPGMNDPSFDASYTPNPYLMDQIRGVGDQISRQLREQVLPQLQAGGVTAGTYGSTKSKVAEGIAARGASEAFTNAATQMLGADYTNEMARRTQRYGQDQGYQIGKGNLGLGYYDASNRYLLGREGLDVQRYGIDTGAATQRYGIDSTAATQRYGIDASTGLGYYNAANNFYLGNQGQMQNFFTQQRGQDLQSAALGAQMYGSGVGGEWTPYTSYSGALQPYSGYGQTTTGSTGYDWGKAVGQGLSIYQGLTAEPKK